MVFGAVAQDLPVSQDLTPAVVVAAAPAAVPKTHLAVVDALMWVALVPVVVPVAALGPVVIPVGRVAVLLEFSLPGTMLLTLPRRFQTTPS